MIVLDDVAIRSGVGLLLAHFLTIFILRLLPPGPWTKTAPYTAHQCVTFPLMCYLAYQGTTTWFTSTQIESALISSDPLSYHSRVLDVVEEGAHLGKIVFGAMLFWDIPIGVIHPGLHEAAMMAHHIGLVFIAGVVAGTYTGGSPVGSFYGVFFIGVIEISTVALVVLDFFRPVHREWSSFLSVKDGGMRENFLQPMNTVFRVIFAILFISFRVLYFPYITFWFCIPDFIRTANLPSEERNGTPVALLYGVVILNVFFAALQMFWGITVIRGVLKFVGLSEKDPDEVKKSS